MMGAPPQRTFAKLLIDGEADPALQAVLVGMLREADPSRMASRLQLLQLTDAPTMTGSYHSKLRFRDTGLCALPRIGS